MAFARAAAAGFDMEHMEDLIAFADCFGASRLRYERNLCAAPKTLAVLLASLNCLKLCGLKTSGG